MNYVDFLKSKATIAPYAGVDCGELHPVLMPHQRKIVRWAVEGGRRAIFARFGLGKTIMQLETIRQVLDQRPAAKALIVCPLGVHQEFETDAEKLGIRDRVHRVKTTAEAEVLPAGSIAITNYEPVRDGKLDPSIFAVASLDEAAILRSYGSKTYQGFLELFAGVEFRFVATATPSPNRYKELIHYAAFLGVMDSGEALTRFFKRDSTQANNLTLLDSQAAQFWLWLASWSAWVQHPADLCDCECHADEVDCDACSCSSYDLPALEITEHRIDVDHGERDLVERHTGQSYLVADAAMGLQDAAREKRETIGQRTEQVIEILTRKGVSEEDQAIVYCTLNDEQTAIEKALTAVGLTFSSIDGHSMNSDEAERRLGAWRNREAAVLLGKPVMLGVGLNLQQANKATFAGIDYRFHDLIQAVHRIQRFGQKRTCEVDLIFAETEQSVRDSLMEKWAQHEELTDTMTDLIRKHGLSPDDLAEALTRSLGVERIEASGEDWTLVHNDCIPETESMESESVGLIVTSIPFNTQYEYSPAYEDLGFNDGPEGFWEQMDYLTPQLLRVLQPGRIYACHVKDRIMFGNVTGRGLPTVLPFHAQAIEHSMRHGFDYLGMITITTDVVRENNQTYRLGWFEMAKDGSKMGVGSPEYILLFHKPQSDRSKGYADVPIVKDKDEYTRARWQIDAAAHYRSSGNRILTPDELGKLGPDKLAKLFKEQSLEEVYSHESHVKVGEELDGRGHLPSTFEALALGSHRDDVWTDVNRMRTMNSEQSKRRVALHLCPLQIDIVERLIRRYSNEGDLVFDPFSGVGTVPLYAIKMGRRGYGVELNQGYFADAVNYLEDQSAGESMPTLFDVLDDEALAA